MTWIKTSLSRSLRASSLEKNLKMMLLGSSFRIPRLVR
jgi:hypothetical protein